MKIFFGEKFMLLKILPGERGDSQNQNVVHS